MSLFDEINAQKQPYDDRKAVQLILKIRHNKSPAKVERYKRDLFFLMGTIVVKNVNNFFKIIRQSNVPFRNILHDKDDITVECYVSLEKCFETFDVNKGFAFYWYFNKTLQRNLFRIASKSYLVNQKGIDYSEKEDVPEAVLDSLLISNQKQDFVDFYISKLNLSEDEKKWLLHKLELKESVNDFCLRLDITKGQYYKLKESVTEKAQVIKEDVNSH